MDNIQSCSIYINVLRSALACRSYCHKFNRIVQISRRHVQVSVPNNQSRSSLAAFVYIEHFIVAEDNYDLKFRRYFTCPGFISLQKERNASRYKRQ
jgi:hypothetical protein